MFTRLALFGLWLAAVAFIGGAKLFSFSSVGDALLALSPLAFVAGTPQTVKAWSKALMVATVQKTFYSRFSGTGSDMPFQVMTDLSKGPGDQIKFDLLQQMSGFGTNGNTAIIDALPGASTQEQNMTFRQETVEVEQKRLAHAWYRMSQQRTVHDLLKAAMMNLSDRFSVIFDRHAAAHLVGLTAAGLNAADTEGIAAANDIDAMGDPVEAHDAAHIYATNIASAFGVVEHLNPARWKAETITDPAPIVPIRTGGNEHYVMFIRPEQAASLQGDADWITAQSNAQVRGDSNPMFTGALGMWNGIVLHSWQYLPYGTAGSATVRYGVLCGRQALAVAFGNAFDVLDQEKYGKDFVFAFVPRELTDYGNIKGMSAGCVFGMRRIMYEQIAGGGTMRTFGCIRVDSTDAAV